MSEVTGISRTSIQRILKHYKWHPYKIQLLHELNEDDHDRRLQFCEIIYDSNRASGRPVKVTLASPKEVHELLGKLLEKSDACKKNLNFC
nr:unnamed protein product [Callosobruchus chinensis]